MKTPLYLLILLFFFSLSVRAQITTPVIKAGFGVDADLRSNYFKGFIESGNDDWFPFPGVLGSGQFVIDTTGATAMMARYAADPNYRKLPFFRTMRVPQLSIVNNRLWIDAVYIRDYNGQSGGDSTAFILSNKNGDNPANWKGGVTSVLDKNDIADMMVHVRRAGPSKSDELWFMGGLSLQGTTGNRYFDFELYQTDIFYSRTTGAFSNYGPDAGHTSWKFDAAGNITSPGDVIFTSEYSNSSLSFIEARVWVHKSALSIKPAAFDWVGDFVGASTGSEYGYANIKPKTSGDYYSGLQSDNGTWAGPFGFIDGGNNVKTTYSTRQFMEFSVSLTKLGLDPITLLGGSACGLPFRRILVKTRTSTSFSSELKDFIGPFDFFATPPVKAAADVSLYCGKIGVSNLKVTNALEASVYTWQTLDGHFVYDSVGPKVTVDKPGTYIVTQQLLDGCSAFAKDTVTIVYDAACTVLEKGLLQFSGNMHQKKAQLKWTTDANAALESFVVQRSTNGKTFENSGVVGAEASVQTYSFTDRVDEVSTPYVYYRLLLKSTSGTIHYSRIIQLSTEAGSSKITVYPNPAHTSVQVSIPAAIKENVTLVVLDPLGRQVYAAPQLLLKGINTFTIDEVAKWPPGMYLLGVKGQSDVRWQKLTVGGRTSF